jgi:hypothetical protein
VKVAVGLLVLAALGALIMLSVIGMAAAIGVLVSVGAIMAMIVLGNLLGGRTTPDSPPYRADDSSPRPHQESE